MPQERGFHLGAELDPKSLQPSGRPLLYDADHLTTHGVCFGMTGSGKTGLCLALLEEALRSGVPALIVDLKGDLANLALTFPNLAPSDFEPWIDAGDAARRQMTPAALAVATSESWRAGLAASQLGPQDVAALRARAEIAVFTPGSTAGRPVNVLGGYAPPGAAIDDDAEAVRARIGQSVAALLDLAGLAGDSMTSPEAVYLAGAFERIWRRGEPTTLEGLIRDLGDPPVQKLGVMDLDDVFPKPKRMAVAMALNGLVAAPAFAAWAQGEALDPATLLASADGRPRASIFYLAHLSDRERSFFLASLLASIVTWMRGGSGSSTLRALVYIDEIFGYMPPHPANPPSKEPLLTLLKQARAFGVGVRLATQNPVDVDYKGLANAGTWMLGRLQTDNDRQRLMEGMSGAGGTAFDRASMERLLSSLPARSVVLHDTRESAPRVFASRWAMSYLRGPMSKDDIRRLPEARPPKHAERPAPTAPGRAPGAASPGARGLAVRPKIADGVAERFIAGGAGAGLNPFLMGTVRLVIEDVKAGVRETRQKTIALPAEAASLSADWAQSREIDSGALGPATTPPGGATYEPVPASWQRAATFKSAATALKGWAAANEAVAIFRNASLRIASRAGETRLEFEGRCRNESAKRRDEELRAYQTKIEEKVRKLRARAEKEQLDVARDEQAAQLRKTQEAVGIGSAVLGALFGSRRSLGTSVLGAGTRHQMSARADAQAEKSRAEAEAARADLDALKAQAEGEVKEIEERWTAAAAAIEETVLRPKKTAIEVAEMAVLWAAELP